MVAVSIQLEGMGLTWPRWKRLVAAIEPLGFAGMYRSDHFTSPPTGRIYVDWLELVVSLAYLADHTQHIRFGPLVAPVSFRDPVMLARQAMALDDLSGGRLVFGIGAGWVEGEHEIFGYHLGDMATRFARLEEALEVITRLLRSDEPVSFEGRFYHLHNALLLPRPQRQGGPPILLGGSGPKRTLPLVARYADIWNATVIAPEIFREHSVLLDNLLRENGRRPSEVRRSIMVAVVYGRDEAEHQRQALWLRVFPELAQASPETLLEFMRTNFRAVIGTPDEVAEGIRRYAETGVEEFIVQWFALDEIGGIELLAKEVLPQLSK